MYRTPCLIPLCKCLYLKTNISLAVFYVICCRKPIVEHGDCTVPNPPRQLGVRCPGKQGGHVQLSQQRQILPHLHQVAIALMCVTYWFYLTYVKYRVLSHLCQVFYLTCVRYLTCVKY